MAAPSRRSAKQPDRMESHPVHRHSAPLCPLQEADAEDFLLGMCEATEEEEQRIPLHTDPGTCRLNDVFVRAHGLPKGEYTIFSSAVDTIAVHPGRLSRVR